VEYLVTEAQLAAQRQPVAVVPGTLSYPNTENAPPSTEIGRSPDKGTSDTPPAQNDPAPSGEAALIPPDQWDQRIVEGKYEGLARSVCHELKGLGASESEIEIGFNLAVMVETNKSSPEWVKWGRDMLQWVHELRKPQRFPGQLDYPNTKV